MKFIYLLLQFITFSAFAQTDTIGYFENSKQIAWKGQICNGKPCGIWTIFCKNRKPAYKIINNDSTFKYIEYDENTSNQITIIELNKDESKKYVKRFQFFDDGVLVAISPFRYGHVCSPFNISLPDYDYSREFDYFNKGSYSSYYPNGQLRFKILIKNGNANGEFKSYFENGVLESEGSLRDNQKTGLWKYYYSTGKLKESGEHFKLLIYEDHASADSLIIKSNFDKIEAVKIKGDYKEFELQTNKNDKYLLYIAQETISNFNGQLNKFMNVIFPFCIYLRKGKWKEYDELGNYKIVEYKDGVRHD